MPLSACVSHTAVTIDDSRGCEAGTGWIEDFLADTGVNRLKGKREDINRCILE